MFIIWQFADINRFPNFKYFHCVYIRWNMQALFNFFKINWKSSILRVLHVLWKQCIAMQNIIFHLLLYPELNRRIKQPNPTTNSIEILQKKNLPIKFTTQYLTLIYITCLFVEIIKAMVQVTYDIITDHIMVPFILCIPNPIANPILKKLEYRQ